MSQLVKNNSQYNINVVNTKSITYMIFKNILIESSDNSVMLCH